MTPHSEEENPFQSTEAPDTEPQATPSQPPARLKWWWECLGFSVLICVVTSYFDFSLTSSGSPAAWGSLTVLAVQGLFAGIGICLLLNYVRAGCFSKLQPGHWPLIAASATICRVLLTEIVFPTTYTGTPPADRDEAEWLEMMIYMPQFVTTSLQALLYIAVVRTTGEKHAWKLFAWLMVVQFLFLAISRAVLITPWYGAFSAEAGLMSFSPTVLSVLSIIILSFPYVVAITLGIGVLRDLMKNIPRDFLHYLGVVITIMFPGFMWWWSYLMTSMAS